MPSPLRTGEGWGGLTEGMPFRTVSQVRVPTYTCRVLLS